MILNKIVKQLYKKKIKLESETQNSTQNDINIFLKKKLKWLNGISKNREFFYKEIIKSFYLKNINKKIKNKRFQIKQLDDFYYIYDTESKNSFQKDEDFQKQLRLKELSMNVKVDDPVKMYLKEIGQIPLLTLEEEREKTQIVYDGRQAQKKINQHNNKEIILTEQQIEEYEDLIKKAAIAKNQLIEANGRLVVSLAKRYIGRKILFLDLIQEGNIGLSRAIDRFRPGVFKLSTYATWWIKQAITRAVADQARTIRIPVHIIETMNKISRCRGKLTQDLARKVNNEEIAKQMNIEAKQIIDIQMIEKETISLEASTREDDDSSLGDFINDPNAISPHEYMLQEMIKKTIDEYLEQSLTDREEQVLKMRYGLLDGHIYTLEEVGNKFGVTRERIRQIEAKALRRLRAPSKQNKLKMLYDNIKK
ncbi:sigma-70 family RNA polymerase sigma factor [Candidatus Phytoplasma palmae]|uniref:sigma-70 family RNA polymerase sigma factor n=1 Tax=Candidatus Phytoplasma palmae TaxID=85624 RepID=UPI00399062D2